jgi:hypothetical protein
MLTVCRLTCLVPGRLTVGYVGGQWRVCLSTERELVAERVLVGLGCWFLPTLWIS